MPITQAESSRLSRRTGLKVDDFSFVQDGVRMLLNDATTRACVFLITSSSDMKGEGMCSVYEIRPKGCQTYPYVLNENDEVEIDRDCRFRDEFDAPPETMQATLLNLEEKIVSEGGRD